MLSYLLEFTNSQGMHINGAKTKVMSFNMSKAYNFPPEIALSGSDFLEVVTEAKTLGVIISNDLKWSKNTRYIVDMAKSRIWTIRRLKNLGFPEDFILEYIKKRYNQFLSMPSLYGMEP